jgi:hypothetical protein
MDDIRFLALVRARQCGPDRVAKALARDTEALEHLRASHGAEPSAALADLLRAADAVRASGTIGDIGSRPSAASGVVMPAPSINDIRS